MLVLNESSVPLLERLISDGFYNETDPLDMSGDDIEDLLGEDGSDWATLSTSSLVVEDLIEEADNLQRYALFIAKKNKEGDLIVYREALQRASEANVEESLGTDAEIDSEPITQAAAALVRMIDGESETAAIDDDSTDPENGDGTGKPGDQPIDPGNPRGYRRRGATLEVEGVKYRLRSEIEGGPRYREAAVESTSEDSMSLVFSTERAVDMFGVREILDHDPGSVRMERLNKKGPLLEDHSFDKRIGRVQSATIDKASRQGRAEIRFGSSERAKEVKRDVQDEIADGISVGYFVHAAVLEDVQDGVEVWRAIDWEPFEISVVNVPADIDAGFERTEDMVRTCRLYTREKEPMENTEKTPAPESNDEKAPDSPNVDVIRDEAERNANTRAAQILKLADKWGLASLAPDAIAEGKTVDEFRKIILENLDKSEKKRPQPEHIGMTENEIEDFSFVRAVRAVALGKEDSRYIKDAAFEIECSDAARSKVPGKSNDGGITIPWDMLVKRRRLSGFGADEIRKRDLTSGTAGDLVGTDKMGTAFIDLLLDNSVILPNATMLTNLNGNLSIPAAATGTIAEWVAENGAITQQDPTFSEVPMSPKTVGALVGMGRRFILQSSIDIEAYVENDIARQIALAIDKVAIQGGGANEPSGILAQGISVTSSDLDWDSVVGLETTVNSSNALMGSLFYVADAVTIGKAKTTPKEAGQAIYIMQDGMMNGYPVLQTNQIPLNVANHQMIFGNLADVLAGFWGGLDILSDPYTNLQTGGVRVRGIQEVDIEVRHVESFAAIDAITP